MAKCVAGFAFNVHDERETAAVGKRGSHAFLDDDLGVLLPELGEQVSREKEKSMQTLGGKEKRHAGFGLFAGLMRGKEKKMKLAGPRDWQQALGGCVVGPVSVCWALPSGLAAAAKRSKLDPNWA